MRAIRSISTGRYGATGFRIAGTAIPWSPWEWTTRTGSPPRSTRGARLVTQWKRTVSGAIRRITRSDVIAESS